MTFHHIAGAAYRALTARKDGPSLYDVCDPLLLKYAGGDPHLGKFYGPRSAIRRCGRCCGGPVSPNCATRRACDRLRDALGQARDHAEPDWAAIGAPVADLLDTIELCASPALAEPAPARAPDLAEIERVIRTCGAHLLQSFGRTASSRPIAAFNLIGDADLRGREMLMALTGLNSRGYKNSTLLFNLARVFIARSPARALINPPWKGIAEPMWQPMQIRHRSAYYDAFFTEALLSFAETGLASSDEAERLAPRHRGHGRFLPHHQPRGRALA